MAVPALSALVAALAVSVHDGAPRWDERLAERVGEVAPVSSSDVHVDPFMQGVTGVVGALTLALAAWLVRRRSYRSALFIVLAIGGAVLAGTLTKGIVERPPIEGPAREYSFPSGSATWSMATAAVLVLLGRTPRERLLASVAGGVLVLGMGAVIVWEEWHYPSDVFAGWLLALACVSAAVLLLRQARPHLVDSLAGRGQYSSQRKEERPAAAPSVSAAERSGGTDTTA